MKITPNLKAGRGAPCAGQVRAIADLSFLINVKDFDSSENFGFVPPTGSIIGCYIFINANFRDNNNLNSGLDDLVLRNEA